LFAHDGKRKGKKGRKERRKSTCPLGAVASHKSSPRRKRREEKEKPKSKRDRASRFHSAKRTIAPSPEKERISRKKTRQPFRYAEVTGSVAREEKGGSWGGRKRDLRPSRVKTRQKRDAIFPTNKKEKQSSREGKEKKKKKNKRGEKRIFSVRRREGGN